MRELVALAAGVLFGGGLALSQMTDPKKVLNFLDVAGSWDPSLAFVMGAALAVSVLGYRVAVTLRKPLLAPAFHLPVAAAKVDGRLLLGASLFGVGWGLVGLCPGPALAGLSAGSPRVALFVAAMLLGTALHRIAVRPRAAPEPWAEASVAR